MKQAQVERVARAIALVIAKKTLREEAAEGRQPFVVKQIMERAEVMHEMMWRDLIEEAEAALAAMEEERAA